MVREKRIKGGEAEKEREGLNDSGRMNVIDEIGGRKYRGAGGKA